MVRIRTIPPTCVAAARVSSLLSRPLLAVVFLSLLFRSVSFGGVSFSFAGRSRQDQGGSGGGGFREEPLVVAPGRYDDPVLQSAPKQGIYKDVDTESASRFVADSRQSCVAYAHQCRAAETEVCHWYGFPKENSTCRGAMMEHIRECENAAHTWRDLKAEARRDVYRQINKEFGTALPAAGAAGAGSSLFQKRGKKRVLLRGAQRRRNRGELRYSPRSRKHFHSLCQECRRAQGDFPVGHPARVTVDEIGPICTCAREYGDLGGLHEKAENMGCDADE